MNKPDPNDPDVFEAVYEIGDMNVGVTRFVHPNGRSVEYYFEGSKAMTPLDVARVLEACLNHITIALDLPPPPQLKDQH